MDHCSHPNAQEKKYVGSTETYFSCPDCFETWGGEETPAKKALIAAAAQYEEALGPWGSELVAVL